MARTTPYRDYAFEAYARSRAKRDRGKRKGPDHQNGAGARDNADQLGGPISLLNNQCERDRQLDDTNWFRKFPKAHFRLRDLNDQDALGDAAQELLRICVARNGDRSFLWRTAP